MSPFEAYGQERAPVIPDSRPDRRKKDPSKLDLKMEEKQRLTKAYLASRRTRRAALLEQEPRLRDLIRYLRRVTAEDGDEMIAAFGACQWLLSSNADIKMFALELVSRKEAQIKLALGFEPLDDPLPPDRSVYQEVRGILRKAGLR